MSQKTEEIVRLSDGNRTSADIADMTGLSARYVRKVQKRLSLPQRTRGAQHGYRNHQYVSGRRIDLDGYVLVTAPIDHPFARKRTNRKGKVMFEHRLIMEDALGRYLSPEEVVDHKDGLTLHNDPLNLRVFRQNGDHLKETITGLHHSVSASGTKNIQERFLRNGDYQPVDTYGRRRKRGDVRLRQILLAGLKLGTDGPYLLGTHRLLRKAGIDPWSRSSLEHALAELNQRYEEDLLL